MRIALDILCGLVDAQPSSLVCDNGYLDVIDESPHCLRQWTVDCCGKAVHPLRSEVHLSEVVLRNVDVLFVRITGL